MAIDPVTAKIIAKAATAVVSNEKGRKAVMGVIIGIVAAVLVILAIPIYILSHPIKFLSTLLGIGTPANDAVIELKTDYDYVVPANNEPVIRIGVYCLPLRGNVTVVRSFETGVHEGIDLAGTPNGPVIAVEDGVVVTAGVVDGINTVKIKHTGENDKTFYSVYSGLFAVFVTVGENVTAEQEIGLEGGSMDGDAGTGGRNLHFELRDENDAAYDPYDDLFKEPVETTAVTETAVSG